MIVHVSRHSVFPPLASARRVGGGPWRGGSPLCGADWDRELERLQVEDADAVQAFADEHGRELG